MLRLVVLFGLTGYVTLLLAGDDKGQMRPGLAAAVASGKEITVLERDLSETVPAPAPEPVVKSSTPPPPIEVVSAAYVAPAPAPTPVKDPGPAPIFTLSTLPTIGGDVADPAPVLAAAEATEAPVEARENVRQVWVVTANSVNVRQGPSTDMGVVGRLTGGEMVTVIGQEGDWAHVLIEGDGLDGYVAARFLTPAY